LSETNELARNVEDELRRLSFEVRILDETAQALQSRMNMVNAVIADLAYAASTLEGLEKNVEGSELLVPVGGSSYIRARLQDADKVIVGVGARVSVEKSITEAKEIVKKRSEELGKTRTSLQQRFIQVAEKANQDRAKFQELANELGREQASLNV